VSEAEFSSGDWVEWKAALWNRATGSLYSVGRRGIVARVLDDVMAVAPLLIELYCGSFGWSAGWLAAGGRSVGFDLEHHPWHGPVPANADLVLQDVLTLSGVQFRDASLILASPPCQAYSYMAMPWKRSKQIAREYRSGLRSVAQLNALFDACFRIQREASQAAGYHIPMIVENVRGAQPWVGPCKANYGSFALWGDIGMVGNRIVAFRDGQPSGRTLRVPRKSAGVKVPGFNFHQHENGEPGGSFQSAQVKSATANIPMWRDRPPENQWSGTHGMALDGTKIGGDWFSGPQSTYRKHGKAASAMIAKIPRPLSDFVARAFWPEGAAEMESHGSQGRI